MFKNLSYEEFKSEIEKSDVTLIDIRTPQEKIIYGIIPKTDLHYDCYDRDFVDKISALNKEKKYALYCFHGNRSKQVQNFMQDEGFAYVVELDGGIAEWNTKAA